MANGLSEWKPYREVKRKVTTELWVQYSIMLFLARIGWINGFHTHVEPQNEIAEV